MSKYKFGLFSRFEDALLAFHNALSIASQHYKCLFQGILNNKDAHNDMVNDTMFYAIQEKRFQLQEEQKRISKLISGEDAGCLTLSEISEKIPDRLDVDIVSIGKECVLYYKDIERHTTALTEYFGSKAEGYHLFFEKLYGADEKEKVYSETGEYAKKQQGVLYRANV